MANVEQTRVIFRPSRKIILLFTLFLSVVTLLNILLFGTKEPFTLFWIVELPGWVMVAGLLVGVVFGLYLLAWSYLPGTETVLDPSGVTLPEHGHVPWDEIDKAELHELALFGWMGMVSLTLHDKRRLYVHWFQMGCKPIRFYRTMQQFVADIERGDGSLRLRLPSQGVSAVRDPP